MKFTYRNKWFVKLELISGKLSIKELRAIGKIIPPHEDDLESFNKEFQGKVDYYIIVKDETIYQQFVGVWYNFYEDFMGIKPKFTGVDGKHLKQIITYLKRVNGTEETALEVWKTILDCWSDLDKFHKDNTDLKYINSRLNPIINAIKQKNQASTTSSGKKFQL